jgi:hypothetical protein
MPSNQQTLANWSLQRLCNRMLSTIVVLPLVPRYPRQRIQHLQHRSIRAIIFPCLVGRITPKVSRALSVAFTQCTDPLKILESSRHNCSDLILVQIKLSHSTGQEIICFRTMLRELTKFRHRQTQVMGHPLSFIFSAAHQLGEPGVCSSPILPPVPHSTDQFSRVHMHVSPLVTDCKPRRPLRVSHEKISSLRAVKAGPVKDHSVRSKPSLSSKCMRSLEEFCIDADQSALCRSGDLAGIAEARRCLKNCRRFCGPVGSFSLRTAAHDTIA